MPSILHFHFYSSHVAVPFETLNPLFIMYIYVSFYSSSLLLISVFALFAIITFGGFGWSITVGEVEISNVLVEVELRIIVVVKLFERLRFLVDLIVSIFPLLTQPTLFLTHLPHFS